MQPLSASPAFWYICPTIRRNLISYLGWPLTVAGSTITVPHPVAQLGLSFLNPVSCVYEKVEPFFLNSIFLKYGPGRHRMAVWNASPFTNLNTDFLDVPMGRSLGEATRLRSSIYVIPALKNNER